MQSSVQYTATGDGPETLRTVFTPLIPRGEASTYLSPRKRVHILVIFAAPFPMRYAPCRVDDMVQPEERGIRNGTWWGGAERGALHMDALLSGTGSRDVSGDVSLPRELLAMTSA